MNDQEVGGSDRIKYVVRSRDSFGVIYADKTKSGFTACPDQARKMTFAEEAENCRAYYNASFSGDWEIAYRVAPATVRIPDEPGGRHEGG